MATKRSAGVVIAGCLVSVMLTGMWACSKFGGGSEQVKGLQQQGATAVATAPFAGDTTNDSLLYVYAQKLAYELSDTLAVLRYGSGTTRGGLDLCFERGSGFIPYADLIDGNWRGLGCVVLSGTVPAQFPYLEGGLSYVMVRRSGTAWQARVYGLTTVNTVTMFVSSGSTAPSVGSDARVFNEGGRIYACYTCDKKSCCPTNAAGITNPTQAQLDVNHIASIW